jgi:hypothetical protein
VLPERWLADASLRLLSLVRGDHGLGLVRDLACDLRYGLRLLARSPAFAVAAISSLGLL